MVAADLGIRSIEAIDMNTPQRPSPFTLLAACLCVLAAERSRLSGEELTLRIGAATVGVEEMAKLTGDMKEVICGRLDAREGIRATADPHVEWRGLPKGADPATWLSLVLVEVRGNLDLLALQWGKDGAVNFAARRPSLDRPYAGVFPHGIPPGPQQTPRNAAIELAAQTGRFLTRESRPDAVRPPLSIAVRSPESGEAGAEDAEAGAENGPGDGPAGLFAKMDDQTVEATTALALAAAWEAGWRPSLKEKAEGDRVTLKLVGRTQALDLQCRAVLQRTETQLVLHRVPEGEIYPYLLRLFRKLKDWGPRVAEFSKVIPPRHRMAPLPPSQAEGYRALGWKDGILAILTEDEKPKLSGLVAATGQAKWTVAEEGEYASLSDRGNQAIVARTGRKLALSEVLPQDGTMEEILEQGAAGRLAADIEAGDAAFAEGRSLTTFVGGAKAWEAKTPLPMGMDPLLTESHVAVGSGDQNVRCFDRATGRLRWTQQIEGRPNTGAALPDGALLFGTREGKLYALTEADGSVRWSLNLTDGLIQPPCLAGDKILIVDGSGSVKLLAPATGKAEAEKRLTGRLIGAAPAAGGEGVLAVAERTGRVTLLAIPSLETVSEADLQARLHQPPFAARNVPSSWNAISADDLEAGIVTEGIKSAFLVVDEDGFIYVLPSAQD